jgi:hypothetical protein
MRELCSILGIAMLAVGCSGDSEPEGYEDDSFTCSSDARSGAYLVTFTEVDGDCGPLSSQVVRLTGELDPTCVLDSPQTLSADQCTVDSSVSCTNPNTGVTLTLIGTTTQQDASASLITGIATIEGYDAQGPICRGTYRLRYERQ